MTSITFEPGVRIVGLLPAARPARATPPPVHLTRRGRLVVFLAALGLVLVAGAWMFGGTSAATDHPQPTRVVVVGSGETLWDIAGDVAPGAHTGDTVAEIQRLNHLDTGMVLAGQRLRVPVAP